MDNNAKVDIRELALKIFGGELTWKEARIKAGLAEKTLREYIIMICKHDKELMEKFNSYSQKRTRHEEINVPAVIINMVKQGRSLSAEADELGISKESLRTLIKKEEDNNLIRLLGIHSGAMRHKRGMNIEEAKEANAIIDEYIKENPTFIPNEKMDDSSINAEMKKIEEFLNFVEKEKKAGKSELQIAKENGFGPAKIRRTRIRLEKLKMLDSKKQNKDTGFEELPL